MSDSHWPLVEASELVECRPTPDLDEEGLRSDWFGRSQFAPTILNGQVTDARTSAAYARLLIHKKLDSRAHVLRPR